MPGGPCLQLPFFLLSQLFLSPHITSPIGHHMPLASKQYLVKVIVGLYAVLEGLKVLLLNQEVVEGIVDLGRLRRGQGQVRGAG